MAEVKKITKEIHLSIEEAKELFPEFEALEGYVITCNPLPITSSKLEMTEKSKEEYQKIYRAKISHLGHLVLSVKDNNRDIKEGEVVALLIGSQSHTSLKREINLSYCFPQLRKYEINLFNIHDLGMKINQEKLKI